LNSTATVTSEDICKHIWPNLQDRTLVLIGRITACVVIVLAMLWSPYCDKFKNIFEVINKVPLIFAPAITTVFMLGVFWKRGTKQAAVATFIVGLLGGLVYFIADLPHNVPVAEVQAAIDAGRIQPKMIVDGIVVNYERINHGIGIPFMMMGLFLLSGCLIVYIVTSLLTPAPTSEDLKKMGWQSPIRVVIDTPLSGITDSRIIAVGLLALMLILYYCLR